jgi:hypothetical protein
MTTIVLNTATGAVTEYDWEFPAISPGHAGSPAGLFALGGNTDAGEPIGSEFRGGTPGGKQVQTIGPVFVAQDGDANGVLIVQGRIDSWEYPLQVRGKGVSAAKPGLGILESYLGLGYRNVGGADFHIERFDTDITASKTRRK